MKHEAATDVATLHLLIKKLFQETKALLNQVVADLYVAHLPFTKYTGTCVDVALWSGIKNGRIHGQLGYNLGCSERTLDHSWWCAIF